MVGGDGCVGVELGGIVADDYIQADGSSLCNAGLIHEIELCRN